MVANYTWYTDKVGVTKELLVRFCTLGGRTLYQYEVRAYGNNIYVNYNEVEIPR